MHEPSLAGWEAFYVIVGSSAGALTGLQFVVMTLIAESMSSRDRGGAISAFGTPNVVHFCAALLVAAILSAPWSALRPAGIAVAACGAAGVVYSVIIRKRARQQGDYHPVFEDWLWHVVLPGLAYAALLVAGAACGRNFADALFVVGGAVLLLVFVGIHNAWDTVTYVTVVERGSGGSGGEAGAGRSEAPSPGTEPASSGGV